MAFASVSRTAHYKLSFAGKLRGHRVVGTFTRKSDDEKLNTGALALLGEGSDDVEFAMIISPAEGSIAMVERQSSTNPRFYTLKAVEAQTQGSLPTGT